MNFFDNKSSVPAHIKGVACDVRSCTYHDEDNYCTASRITVGPTYATSCTDTVCATFKPKSKK